MSKAGLKAHPTDVVSLVFGLIFVAIAFWWVLDVVFGSHLALGWVVAGTLIAVGGIGVLAAVRPSRTNDNRSQ